MILRPATSRDSTQVADVYLASRKKFLSFAPLANSEEDVRIWISNVLIPSGNVTIAEVERQVVGMICVSVSDGMSWIDHLYISPDFVHQKIGSKLLLKTIINLSPPIHLNTFQQNIYAKAFYEKHGFRELSRSDGAGNEEQCPDILYALSGESFDSLLEKGL